jgi:hypothetical protein
MHLLEMMNGKRIHDYRMLREWIVDPYEHKSVDMEKEEIDYP